MSKHEIEDAEVVTLGLVTAGATREEIFLTKSADDQIAHDDKAVWKRMVAIIRKAFTDELTAIEAATTTTPESSPSVSTADVTEMPSEQPVVENSTAVSKDHESPATDQSGVTDQPTLQATSVTNSTEEIVTMSDEIAKSDLEAQLSELAKANEEMRARLEKAEAEASQAKEQRDRDAMLVKARGYNALPIAPAELADHLYWLSKADEKRATWFEGVLKAIDARLADAAFYSEIGTTNVPDVQDAVMKASLATNPRDALLALPADVAARYVYEMRKMAKGA